MRDTPPCSPPVRRADCGPKLGVRGAVDFDQCSVDTSVQIARGRSFVITLIEFVNYRRGLSARCYQAQRTVPVPV